MFCNVDLGVDSGASRLAGSSAFVDSSANVGAMNNRKVHKDRKVAIRFNVLFRICVYRVGYVLVLIFTQLRFTLFARFVQASGTRVLIDRRDLL